VVTSWTALPTGAPRLLLGSAIDSPRRAVNISRVRLSRLGLVGLVVVLALADACGSSARAPAPVAAPVAPPQPTSRALTVERIPGPAVADPGRGDGHVTLVRFDLRGYRLVIVPPAGGPEAWRTVPDVARASGLAGAINAAMFEPDGRASGLLVIDGLERAPDDPRFGGVLAFDPIDPAEAPVVMVGRDCPGVDLASLRARYRSLVANYRLLGCEGRPIAWVDESTYSSAALALDREGRFVLVHAETPYLMRDLARVLADPALGLVHVHYVEGGPKATIFADDGSGSPLVLWGSREEEEEPGAPRRGARPVPNVLGLIPFTTD
jgi:hypothetical protein